MARRRRQTPLITRGAMSAADTYAAAFITRLKPARRAKVFRRIAQKIHSARVLRYLKKLEGIR